MGEIEYVMPFVVVRDGVVRRAGEGCEHRSFGRMPTRHSLLVISKLLQGGSFKRDWVFSRVA